jgi:hypothetical protein
MADVKVPGLGHMKKGYVIAIAGGGLVIAVYIYRKQKATNAATNAAATTLATTGGQLNGYPWDGTVGNSADPQSEDPTTSMTYAQEAAEGTGVYTSASGAGASTPLAGLSGVTTTSTSASSAPTTNSAWAQQATANLVSIGYASTDVAAALGQYLASLPLTAAQQNIVQVALAEDGPPPVGSFSIITTGPTPTPAPTPTPTPTPSPSPTPTPTPSGGGTKPGAITGLRLVSKTANAVTLAWNAASGATHYNIAYGYPSVSQFHTTSNGPSVTIGFAAGHGSDYHFQVTAQNAAGNGPYSTPLIVTGI